MNLGSLVGWIDANDFDGWGAETVGAFIGGLFAVLVAFGVATRETKRANRQMMLQREEDLKHREEDLKQQEKQRQARWLAEWQEKKAAEEARAVERRAGVEARRLDQFVGVLIAIQDLAPAIDRSAGAFEAAVAEVERRTMAWSAYLIDEEELDFEDVFRKCLTELLKVARHEHDTGGTTENFRTSGHEGKRMQDGIFTNGKRWHADPGRRAEATTWFDESAWKY